MLLNRKVPTINVYFSTSSEAGKIALNQFIQQEALNDGGGDGHAEDGMIDAVTGEQITEETIVEHQGQDADNHVRLFFLES